MLRIARRCVGTLGVLLCERAGVLNLGIEGIMVAGAFSGWLAVYLGLPLWAGVAVAALTGMAFGALHAFLTVALALSQHVSGLGITLLATALSAFAYRVSFPKVSTPPTVTPFAPMEGLGIPILSAQTPLTLLGMLLVRNRMALYRTRPGWNCAWWARTRRRRKARASPCCRAQSTGVIAGSALMGVAAPSSRLSASTPLLQHGQRPWLICVALVVFASWRPGKALLGALLFAFFDALQLRLQQSGAAVLPYQVYLMLPYALSILALVLVARRAAYPQALMKPYRKGER